MNVKVRSSEFIDLEPIQPTGTATVVTGTGAFIAPISMLRELSGDPQAFEQFIEALEAQERRDMVPNSKTIAAIEEARRGGLKKFATVEDLMADLDEDD